MLNNITQILPLLEHLSKSYEIELLTKEEISQGNLHLNAIQKNFQHLNYLIEKGEKSFKNNPQFIKPLLNNLDKTTEGSS